MSIEQFANKSITTLNGAIDGVVTSLAVTSASLFPVTPQFRVLIGEEILLVTGVAGSTFVVSRGVEGTSGVAHANGAVVTLILTAGSLVQLKADVEASLITSTAPADVTKATAAVGVATTAARADHKHNVTTATAGAATPGDTTAEGTATSLARSDHRHSLPAYGSTSGTFCQGNDSRLSDDRTASGIRTATTVVVVSSATAPSNGQVLTATSGTAAAWATPTSLTSSAPADVTKATAAVGVATDAARSDHKHNVTTATAGAATPGDSAAEGTATSLARSDHQHSLPAYGSTLGTFCQGNDSRLSDDRTASGIRTATTVVVVSAATAPTNGQVLTATSGTAAAWATPTGSALRAITNTTSNYQVLAADDLVVVGDRSTTLSITLTASPSMGETHSIKDGTGQAAAYSISVVGNGHNIDGLSTLSMSDNYSCVTVTYNGTQWGIV